MLLLPLLALGFRRGWIAVWALCLVLPQPRAEAFEWADLWERPDQRGYEALQSEQAARAAELFEDPAWRGAAQYRAGHFEDSAATLDGVDTADGHYNRGNALAKSGELEPAIAAYDRALELDPEHADARYNRDLVQQYLDEQQDQQQQSQNESGEQSEQGQSQDGSSDPQEGEQANADRSQPNDESQQGEQQESQAQAGDGQGPEEPAEQSEEERNDQRQAENDGEQQPGDAEPAPGPEDVEKWASEQAAEQWLRRIPQDPGGLLRRKFLYQYQRLGVDQEGKSVLDGAEAKPW